MDWLYGFHPVREALRAGRRKITRVWIREGADRPDLSELAAIAASAGVLVERVPREAIEARVSPEAQSQGVADNGARPKQVARAQKETPERSTTSMEEGQLSGTFPVGLLR